MITLKCPTCGKTKRVPRSEKPGQYCDGSYGARHKLEKMKEKV